MKQWVRGSNPGCACCESFFFSKYFFVEYFLSFYARTIALVGASSAGTIATAISKKSKQNL